MDSRTLGFEKECTAYNTKHSIHSYAFERFCQELYKRVFKRIDGVFSWKYIGQGIFDNFQSHWNCLPCWILEAMEIIDRLFLVLGEALGLNGTSLADLSFKPDTRIKLKFVLYCTITHVQRPGPMLL